MNIISSASLQNWRNSLWRKIIYNLPTESVGTSYMLLDKIHSKHFSQLITLEMFSLGLHSQDYGTGHGGLILLYKKILNNWFITWLSSLQNQSFWRFFI